MVVLFFQVVFVRIMTSMTLDMTQHTCFQEQTGCINKFNQLFIYKVFSV